MNKKEINNLRRDWGMVILAALIGSFLNIAANAFYDFYAVGFKLRFFIIFLMAIGITIFIIGLFSYIFDNPEELNSKDRVFSQVIKNYIKSWFNKSKSNNS